MRIIITNHAIKRYRERLFDYVSSDEYITELLTSVARRGTFVKHRPGKCIEVYAKGIYIVLLKDCNRLFVVTCLGDIRYLKWVRREGGMSLRAIRDYQYV